jgi:DNA-methyltransferase (dcm)
MNFIDLFAGAGGLSEGFYQAGFEPICHIEMMKEACETLTTRAFYYYLKKNGNDLSIYKKHLQEKIDKATFESQIPQDVKDSVICQTMSDETLPDIFETIEKRMTSLNQSKVDVIIGGPPCQAYSIVGRSRTDMSKDPRNHLYLLYLEFLERFSPSIFVFENVQGILTAGGGKFFKDLKKRCKLLNYRVENRILKAEDYGVLQKRRREIIIGIRTESCLKPEDFPFPKPDAEKYKDFTVHDLLTGLPALKPGGKNNTYCRGNISKYLKETKIRQPGDVLTWHQTRPIRAFDQQIYKFVIEYTQKNHRTPDYTEIPPDLQTHKNKTSFLDRFKVVQANAHACQTMVAHISKDGHYYIYPDPEQLRSLSVREAARIQSFPDNFYFEGHRTSAFVQIGNAVPPLLACAVANSIKVYLEEKAKLEPHFFLTAPAASISLSSASGK